MGIGRLETSEDAASAGSVSEQGLAQTLVRLREAVVGEDWDGLRELWVKLPADFQSSRAGRGIWAGMKRGIGEFGEAAQIYFELYKSRERTPLFKRRHSSSNRRGELGLCGPSHGVPGSAKRLCFHVTRLFGAPPRAHPLR